MSARLYIVATPIGNLADITLRAVRILSDVEVIAAEDTRTAKRLLTHHGVSTPLVSYYEHNAEVRVPELIARLADGESVALISEAGTPSISDPGYRLVGAAIEAGIIVEPIPGASALLAALVVSGLPTDAFVFEGFLPRKAGERKRHLEAMASEHRTLVFFEAPHRVDACLSALLEVLGDRQIALCRELTKMHEEVRRGSISEVVAAVRKHPVKGEIVLVVAGATPVEPDFEAAVQQAVDRVAGGASVRDAATEVATEFSVSRRALYDRVIAARAEKD